MIAWRPNKNPVRRLHSGLPQGAAPRASSGVQVETSLLQKRAHGRARPPDPSPLGRASEGWPPARAGRGKQGGENQRQCDPTGWHSPSRRPPSLPALCALRPTTSLIGFLPFHLEEPWTAAQLCAERHPRAPRCPPPPRHRGRLLQAPQHSTSSPGSTRREPEPPSERPRSPWCLVTPARPSSGGCRLRGGGWARRRPRRKLPREPLALRYTGLETTRQQRLTPEDSPIRPLSQGNNASFLPFCAVRPPPTPAAQPSASSKFNFLHLRGINGALQEWAAHQCSPPPPRPGRQPRVGFSTGRKEGGSNQPRDPPGRSGTAGMGAGGAPPRGPVTAEGGGREDATVPWASFKARGSLANSQSNVKPPSIASPNK